MDRRTLGFGFVILATVFYLAPYAILAVANSGDTYAGRVEIMVHKGGYLIHLHDWAALAGALALVYMVPDALAPVMNGVKRWWQRRKAKAGEPES